MRTRMIRLTAFISFALFPVRSGQAGENTSPPERNAASTATVTHIEYDGSRFMKLVEITQILPYAKAGTTGSTIPEGALNALVPFLIQGQIVDGHTQPIVHVGVVRIPFSHLFLLRRLLYDKDGRPVEAHDENPFNRAIPFDQPLFSLFDFVAVLPPHSMAMRPPDGKSTAIEEKDLPVVRKRFLDSLVFCLYRKDRWDDGQYEVEWCRFPLTSTYAREKSRKRSSLRILDSDLFSIFKHVDEKEKKQTRILATFVASVFEQKQSGDGDNRWVFLDVPLVSALLRAESEERSQFTVLGTVSMSSSFTDWRQGPHFALWHQERRGEEKASFQLLRLPLLGPVGAYWREAGDDHWGVLPRLMFWQKFPY